jgi:hypothetical protein
MAKLRDRCSRCGSVDHPTTLCPYEGFEKETLRQRMARMRAEEEKRKLIEGSLKIERRERTDGITWMVSIIHPDHPGGSTFYSERMGKNAKEAALSYFNDPTEDSKGASLAHKDPEMTLIVVVDNQDLIAKKAWKVTIFMPQKKTDGSFELVEFS